MNTETAILVLAILAIALVTWRLWGRRRSETLRDRFGPEYDHEVNEQGRRRGESELRRRAKRVDSLDIRALPSTDRSRYRQRWNDQQAHFVDDPEAAVGEADVLINEVMELRGYPVGDFEQRVADVSVDHPDVVMNYRAAREIAQHHAQGKATTEDLRQAMVHYRALFRDLLETVDEPVHDDTHHHIPAGRH